MYQTSYINTLSAMTNLKNFVQIPFYKKYGTRNAYNILTGLSETSSRSHYVLFIDQNYKKLEIYTGAKIAESSRWVTSSSALKQLKMLFNISKQAFLGQRPKG